MNLRLVVDSARGRRQVLWIDRASAVVGRAHGSAVRIPSVEVSRRHCRLRQVDGVVTVEDLDSVNGTFLNGRPVSGPQLLRPGDRLVVGPVTFIVEYDLSEEALERFEGSGVAEAIEEVLPAEEDEGAQPVNELTLETLSDADLPALDVAEGEELEDAPATSNIFDFDEDKWEMPRGGLHDVWSEADESEDEAETDEK
jgi:pSer/pThr/pTyr-binding forkhead associated (FHA) protein